MIQVKLVRHGQTDWNLQGRLQGIEDNILNNNGVIQSHQCGKLLKDTNFDIVLSSPLKRATATANIICNYINTNKITELTELKEMDFGDISGKTEAEISMDFANYTFFEKESKNEFELRLNRVLKMLEVNFNNMSILIVAHGSIISGILDIVSNGITKDITILNGSISSILLEDGQWKIEYYNKI